MKTVVEVIIEEGSALGLRSLEDPSGTVKGTFFPLGALDNFAGKEEGGTSGVYILFGRDEEETDGEDWAYIGLTECVVTRLKQWRNKGWYEAAVFTSRTDSVSRTHIGYVEKKLIHKALELKRIGLKNAIKYSADSKGGNIPETERIASDKFFSEVQMLLEVSGKKIVTPWATQTSREEGVGDEVFEFKGKWAAQMIRSSAGFVVLEGSQAKVETAPSASEWIVKSRQDLQGAGVIEEEEGVFLFRSNCDFASPSAAAAAISGCNENGNKKWTLDGRTLGDLLEEEGSE